MKLGLSLNIVGGGGGLSPEAVNYIVTAINEGFTINDYVGTIEIIRANV